MDGSHVACVVAPCKTLNTKIISLGVDGTNKASTMAVYKSTRRTKEVGGVFCSFSILTLGFIGVVAGL